MNTITVFANPILKVIIISIVIGFVLCVVLEAMLLPMLRRLQAGQTIRDEGPKEHQKKSGTPTMGGIAIIAAFVIGSFVAAIACLGAKFGGLMDIVVIAVVTVAYSAIGFLDDYIKVMKKRNLGLTEIQKLILQCVVALALAIYSGINYGTYVSFPILNLCLNFRLLYYPFIVFVVVAMTNAVNLTDGLDGLAASVTSIVAFTFACISTGNSAAATICAAVVCGSCLGFLVFNHHPAKVFMGDTGSLALGGCLSAIAIISKSEFVLPIAGIVYVLEALSVIIQVYVFKTQNGRRFFRMAPLHHHFELGGMKETRVVMLFCGITIIACVIELILG
ncbi:MAG: phospho-N-acetylmuramoyl-pentapeptide-transferase [Clostridia bacterium]|nr:phospho-N-acetylmuramoyl-pentapeptide-transferase [Clostridia bacterium]